MDQYWKSLQITIRLIFYCFSSSTNVEAFDLCLNIFFKAQLPIFLAEKFSGFINTKIICQKIVMMPIDKLGLNNFKYS